MASTELKLRAPIVVHGETVDKLTVRRATAREMRELPIGGTKKMGDLYDFAAACCDIPPSSIDQLDAADMVSLMGVVSGFLDAGIGETPSV